MTSLWQILGFLHMLLGIVSCTKQGIKIQVGNGMEMHSDSLEDTNILSNNVGVEQDAASLTSHVSSTDEETCSNLEESRCSIHTSSIVSGDGRKEEAAKYLDDMSSAIDGIEDEISNKERESAVKVLRQEGDFEKFIKMAHVVIVFFYKYSNSEALDRFLVEYDVSANHLLQYGIFLALADCSVYTVGSYCNSEKVNRFAYGFREGQEKIAFPLDTLFNNNAIVASALHLDLINAVPILQTAGERHEIERRCKGRCDIIFSYQRTLGTYEHRMFLEIAHAYQDNYVFAITTYTAGTLGLSNPDSQSNEDVEQRIWVVHCADKTIQEPCVVSHYRHKMLLPDLLQFLAALQLPKWFDAEVSPAMDALVTPYDGTTLPWVILIYDSSCKHRVLGLAPDLAQLLHGSVATITLDLDRVSNTALENLGLERNRIATPAIAFLHQEQETTSLLNDYDDPLEWVNEKLIGIYEKPSCKEELEYQPVHALEELVQDDEVVLGMQREETFTNIYPLSGPEAYDAAISANELTVITFYLAWDPVSNTLLQHMNVIAPKLAQFGSQAALHRINCFDWPRLCDGLSIAGYPELRMYMKDGQYIKYSGPIHSESIARTILLYSKPLPMELHNAKEVESFLSCQPELHLAGHLMDAAVVGIFQSKEESSGFLEAAQMLRSTHLSGYYISKQGVQDMCGHVEGCIVVSKPRDPLQPKVVLNSGLQNITSILTFLHHSTKYVLAPLDFESLNALSAMKETDDSMPAANQYLLIFFIPSGFSLPVFNEGSPQTPKDEGKWNTSEEDTWAVFGHLAVEFSEPGFVFSWIKGDDPLAEKLSIAYNLTPAEFSLVAVNWKHGSDGQKRDVKETDDIERSVLIYACPDLSPHAIRLWLASLKDGNLKPSVVLGETDWEPRLPGFDYIKFMMEDEDRDAEDHLMLEMERDLSSSHHHSEDSEGMLHMHKEL